MRAAVACARLLQAMPHIELSLVIGQYAIDWHLPDQKQNARNLTDTVRAWREHWPAVLPMPRNNRWLKANSWFEAEVVPALQTRVRSVLAQP